MKLLAAYVLLILGGNSSPTAENITNLITTIGGEIDETQLTNMISDLEGKDIHELLAKGDNDLKSVVGVSAAPSGASSAPSGSAPAATTAAPVAEPVKPKEEEVDALEGGMDMFGGGGGGGGDY